MPDKNLIDPTCTIADGCVVNRSELKLYSRLKSNVEFRDSILGEYSYVSSGSIVNKTVIGKFTSIGPGCYIGLWEHDTDVSTHSFYLYETSGFFVKGYKNYKKDDLQTFIGSDVWVGANVSIKKGVSIGNGAILGSSSVITKEVEPYSIVVGNPGHVIKYRYDSEDIKMLIQTRWWDFPREEIQLMVDKGLFQDFDAFKNYITQNKAGV
jgi:chloramphenicol O-acetyltransferase type B